MTVNGAQVPCILPRTVRSPAAGGRSGGVVYVGALLDPEGQAGLTDRLGAARGVTAAPITVPPGVEAATRQGPDGLCCVLLNPSNKAVEIALPEGAHPVVGVLAQGRLAPLDVMLIHIKGVDREPSAPASALS